MRRAGRALDSSFFFSSIASYYLANEKLAAGVETDPAQARAQAIAEMHKFFRAQ